MSGERVEVDLGTQRLRLWRDGRLLREYAISTARAGPGEREGSECTPRGEHVIGEKIGAGCAPGTVFVGRRPTGEIWSPALRAAAPQRDWILTRILWLDGREPGRNRDGDVDSRNRYIYIHGAPPDVPMGVPGSRGCIRMRDPDLLELFDAVEAGTPVIVHE